MSQAHSNPRNCCPYCGGSLPMDSPAGLCPDCLLRQGLGVSANLTPFHSPVHSRGAEPSGSAPSPAGESAPKPDEIAPFFPQYEILDLVGCGGMGAVYKARQKSLDRVVALKIIRPDSAREAGFAERFAREARAMAKLNHPNIVAVHDFGSVATGPRVDDRVVGGHGVGGHGVGGHGVGGHGVGGHGVGGNPALVGELFYLVMEFVEGANLRQLIASRSVTPEMALTLVPQICEALQFAHDEGVVHRDIKPENILVEFRLAKGPTADATRPSTYRARVKIADFGLAKLVDHPADVFSLTGSRQVMGTPRYMAPEQMDAAHTVDHRADIYSLGVVFYELLTGEVPAGRFDPPSKRAEVDARLDEIVLRSLAREPQRRYQHASDVKVDVENVARSHPPAHGPMPLGDRTSSQSVPAALAGAPSAPLPRLLTQPIPESLPWTGIVLGAILFLSALALIAWGMWVSQSNWVLLGLVVPWFLFAMSCGYLDERRYYPPLIAIGLLSFFPTAGLVAAAMWHGQSGWPLLFLVACGAAFIGGAATGHEILSSERTSHGSDKNADDRDENSEDELETKAESPKDVIEQVAWALGFWGVLRCLNFFPQAGKLFNQVTSGGQVAIPPSGFFVDLLGTLVLIAAIVIYQRRGFWIAIAASLTCISSGSMIGIGIGIWSLANLSKAHVRAAFLPLFESSGKTSVAMPAILGPAKLGPAIMEQFSSMTASRAAHWILGVIYVVCLFAFISFSATTTTNDSGKSVFRHHVGFPTPWFTLESTVQSAVPSSNGAATQAGFEWRYFLHTTSSAWLVAATGLAAGYRYATFDCQSRPRVRFWHTPTFFVSVWIVLSTAAAALGLIGLSFSPRATPAPNSSAAAKAEGTESTVSPPMNAPRVALMQAVAEGNASQIRTPCLASSRLV